MAAPTNTELERLSQAEHMLAVIARADEALKLADMAEAARVYARKAELGTAAVNHATIIKARALKRMAELVDAGQARGEIATAKDTLIPVVRSRDNSTPAPATLSDLGITRQRLHEARKLEPLSDAQIAEVGNRATEEGREVTVTEVARAASSDKMAVHYSSASPDWNTPPEIIDRVVRALGAIDLDPCSNSVGAPNVPAARHFKLDDDGLGQEWVGRVYMNPPYGRPIAGWVEKLCGEYRAGRVSAAVALVPARTDTTWFQMLRDAAICFIDGRLRFSGHQNSAPFPSAAAYLGTDVGAFASAFAGAGDVWIRWERRG